MYPIIRTLNFAGAKSWTGNICGSFDGDGLRRMFAETFEGQPRAA
jgi:hypothetical protein